MSKREDKKGNAAKGGQPTQHSLSTESTWDFGAIAIIIAGCSGKTRKEQMQMNENVISFPNRTDIWSMKITESYKVYKDIDDLSKRYVDCAMETLPELLSGDTSLSELRLLLVRATYSCYIRGYEDAKEKYTAKLRG